MAAKKKTKLKKPRASNARRKTVVRAKTSARPAAKQPSRRSARAQTRAARAATRHPFQLGADDFARLTDAPFVHVLNNLLRLEAVTEGMPLANLDLSWKEKAPDGGVDASTESEAPAGRIPAGKTLWQFKAGGLAPGQIQSEFAGSKRKGLREQLVVGAEYVLVLGEDPGDLGRRRREQALRAALASIGAQKSGVIVTAADLATWAARYPGLLSLPEFGRPVGGLIPFEVWRKSDKHRRAFAPTAPQARMIRGLREDLSGVHHGDGTYRVSGRSGFGKTRAVLEALDLDELRPRVVYVQDPERLPKAFVSWLASTPDATAVLVVDECDAGEHSKIAEALATCRDRVVLVTIGPTDSGGPILSGRFNLERASTEELEAILKAGFPGLADETRRFVGRLSSGYVRAAILLAERYNNGSVAPPGELAEAEDLATFLEGLQGASPPAEMEDALLAASLFTAIGVDGDLEAELRLTAELIGKTVAQLKTGCTRAAAKGLLEARGRMRFVSPEILAIRLAARFWAERKADLAVFYDKLPQGTARHRFVERLVSFGEDSRTRTVIAELLSSDSVFRDVSDLNSKDRAELLNSLATALPTQGAEALDRLLSPASVEDLKNLNGGRRAVVWSLEKLVWLPETFERAARLLLALAEAENERYSNNATGIWHQLFRPLLSGTAVPGLERLALLEEILFDERQSIRRRELALEGLFHVFEQHVSRGSVMDSLGGKPLPDEWRPRTVGDMRAVMNKAFELLERVSAETSDLGARAIDEFIDSFRMVLSSVGDPTVAMMRKLIQAGSSELKARAAKAIGAVLAYDRDELPGGTADALAQLQDEALANDFSARLRRWLGKPGPEDHKLEMDDPGQLERVGRELADEAWADRSLLEKEWTWLVSANAQRFWPFFVRLGELDTECLYTAQLEGMLSAEAIEDRPTPQWSAALEGHRRAGRGEWAWQRIRALAQDSRTAGSSLDALWRSEPSERAALLIAEMIRANCLGPHQPGILIYGNWIGKTTEAGAVAIIDALVSAQTHEASQTALALLGMRLRPAPEHKQAFGDLLWKVLEATASDHDDQMGPYNWSHLANFLVEEDPVRVAVATLKAFAGEAYISERDERVEVLLEAARLKPAEVWPRVIESVESGWKARLSLQSSLGGRLLSIIPTTIIREWVGARGEDGANTVMELSSVGPELSELQRALLVQFPGSKNIRSTLLARMHTGVFSGEISNWHSAHLEWVRNWARDPEPVIRNWALSLIPGMEAEIRAAQQREAEEDL
jgi:hypothetical protein